MMFLSLCQDMEELWRFRNLQHFELICPTSTLPDAYKGVFLGFNHMHKKILHGCISGEESVLVFVSHKNWGPHPSSPIY